MSEAPNIKSPAGTAQVDYKPASLVPITDPNELKQATVRDYKRWSERCGFTPTADQLEAQAVRDLTVVDLLERGTDVTANAPKPKPPSQLVDQWSKPIEEGGQGLAGAAPADRYRPGVLYQPAQQRSEKWSRATARIKRIVEGIKPKKYSSLKAAALDAARPDLALRYLQLEANFKTRGMRQTRKHNPFFGMKAKDAARKFEAEVYAICDASTGFAGTWWVPK